jgi:hypothetical protein
MEVKRETQTVFVLNAITIPAIAYPLIADALHLGDDAKVLLAIVLGTSGLGLTMWRWWSAWRESSKPNWAALSGSREVSPSHRR